MICHKDDTGSCCGMCGYNPVVVMATHQRVEITRKNIQLLLKQECKIVLVVSDAKESAYYYEMFPQITVCFKPNNPLGAKWQYGVDNARELNPNPLIICGSDDILSKDFIKKVVLKMSQGWDMIGLTEWYTFDEVNNKFYKMKYKGVNEFTPIGSGKCISKSLLEKMKYILFEMNANRKLDDMTFSKAKIHRAKIFLNGDLFVMAVKGNWPVLNSVKAYLTGKNVSAVEVKEEEIKTHFDYVL
jgi:hypothetical protein